MFCLLVCVPDQWQGDPRDREEPPRRQGSHLVQGRAQQDEQQPEHSAGSTGIISTEGQLRSSAHPGAAERFLKARNSPSLVSNGVRCGIGQGRHLFRS